MSQIAPSFQSLVQALGSFLRKDKRSFLSKSKKILKGDIKYLLENSSDKLKKDFDEEYGDGAAKIVLKSAKVGGARRGHHKPTSKKGKRGHCGGPHNP